MRKFSGLMRNEWVKIWGKLSSKVLLGVVLLAAVGFAAIAYFGERQLQNRGAVAFHSNEITPHMRIVEAMHFQVANWERVVARYQFFIDHDIELIQTLHVHGWQRARLEQHPQAWRSEAIYFLFGVKWQYENAGSTPSPLVADMEAAILADDWLGFVTARLDWFTLMHTAPVEIPGLQLDVHADLWYMQQVVAHGAHHNTWQYEVITQVREMMRQVARSDIPLPHLHDMMVLGEYRLAHGLEYYTARGMELVMGTHFNPTLPAFWRGFAPGVQVVAFLAIVLIVLAGGIVAGEYTNGTIKFLLINPVARWKILTAKYAVLLQMALVLLAVLFLANFITAGIIFGFDGLTVPMLRVVNGAVVRSSPFLFMASRYLLGAVGMVVLATFAFMLSALVRSQALAIGLGLSLYFGGWTAVLLLRYLGFYQARYILFANTNIINVASGATGFVQHGVLFAVINIAVHMVVFLLTAWDAFTRTDVK